MFFVFDSAAKIFRLFVVRHFLEYRVGQGAAAHESGETIYSFKRINVTGLEIMHMLKRVGNRNTLCTPFPFTSSYHDHFLSYITRLFVGLQGAVIHPCS